VVVGGRVVLVVADDVVAEAVLVVADGAEVVLVVADCRGAEVVLVVADGPVVVVVADGPVVVDGDRVAVVGEVLGPCPLRPTARPIARPITATAPTPTSTLRLNGDPFGFS
jgi:hypothetical protein